MKKHLFITVIGLLCLPLAACGPKTVGEDTPKMEISGAHPSGEPADQLRYPLSGRALDQRLYLLNQPNIMINMQNYQRERMGRIINQDRGPNDYNNLQPRQISPFRQ